MADYIIEAVERINGEMQKRAEDPYVEIIGQYVIDRICGGEAGKVTEKMTLAGAMDAVKNLASKNKHGSVAVLTPDQVFGAVDTYFKFGPDEAARWKAMGMSMPPANMSVRPAGAPAYGGAGRMELDLDSLLD